MRHRKKFARDRNNNLTVNILPSNQSYCNSNLLYVAENTVLLFFVSFVKKITFHNRIIWDRTSDIA